MKVLFLTNIPSPYRVDFFNEISKSCELTVIYEREASTERSEQWIGLASGGYEQIFLSGVSARVDAGFNPGIIKYLKRGKYNVTVVGGYATPTAMLAITVLHKRKIPFILNADGGFICENEAPLKRKLKQHFISKASRWLSTGPMTSEYLMHYGAKPEGIFIYPFSSVRDGEIPDAPISREQKLILRGSKNLRCETLVLAVGQFIERKGFLEFLKTWVGKSREGMGLVVIGGGPEEAQYRAIAGEHSNVWILPFLKKEVLADYYRAADAFVLPTNEDIWGLVINEAMSYGLPVFSTDKCIAAVTMRDDSVEIFPAEDNEALMDAILAFSENVSFNYDFGEISLGKSRQYTIERMAARHISVFEEIEREK